MVLVGPGHHHAGAAVAVRMSGVYQRLESYARCVGVLQASTHGIRRRIDADLCTDEQVIAWVEAAEAALQTLESETDGARIELTGSVPGSNLNI